MYSRREVRAHNIKRLRDGLAISQRDFAAMVGVSASTICQIEQARLGCSEPTIKAIAKALGVAPAKLVCPLKGSDTLTAAQEHARNAKFFREWHKLNSLSAQDQSLVRALADRLLKD